MRRLILLILIATITPIASSAQMYAMRDSVANGYDFWLYLPDSYTDRRAERLTAADSVSVDRALPVVVFLHGRSLSGKDINKVRQYGTIDALWRGRQIEALVIAPQVNYGDWWRPERVLSVVEWVSKRYDVDLTRLYVLGMSLGGYGALDFAATYPEKTAAAIALCGGSTKRAEKLAALNDVPLWIMHGTADSSVPVSESRRVVEAMKAADATTPRLRYDEHAGAGHSIYARTFYLPEAYEWMFKHATTDSLRQVDHGVQIPYSRFNNAYSGLPRGGGKAKIIDPPTRSTTKGRYMGEEIPQTKGEEQAKQSAPPKASTSATMTSSASSTPATTSYTYHTIVDGDTLGHIAQKYGTTVKCLCELNNIEKTAILKLGTKLRVAVENSAPATQYHTIADGDSLWSISQKYGTTIEHICSLNGFDTSVLLLPGDKIIVTGTTQSTQSQRPTPNPMYHTIVDGDTLGHIALKYNTTVKRLCELNNIEKSAVLKLGKQLRVR